MEMQDCYTHGQVAVIFKVRPARVAEAREAGLLPGEQIRGVWCYDRAYIDGLNELLRLANEKFGRVYTELYHLQYRFERVLGTAGQCRQERSLINDRCRKMVADDMIIMTSTLADWLKAYVGLRTVRKWHHARKIAAVRIGTKVYVSSMTAKHLVMLFGWETLETAAVRLNATVSQLYRAYSRGDLKGGCTPDRAIHLRPGFKWRSSEGWLTREEAAIRMRVAPKTLKLALGEGRVKGAVCNRGWLVPPEEVARWNTYLSTLNPKFEWLQRRYGRVELRAMLIGSSETQLILGITAAVRSNWALDNLLPFIPTSLTGKKPRRAFVRLYVEGLARFAITRPVTKTKAREYAIRCATAKRIL